ncbi:hypothetical protein VP01_1935g1 [Puccinia sorghi]|uniref:Uncharacterized protein n=1 Tax=Puccinia sorghi TaxID=27349 RepID=A0A0L6VCB1_9BASI|nr:hypothetical protein VP01_1935g1 [Puccinia sorghi]
MDRPSVSSDDRCGTSSTQEHFKQRTYGEEEDRRELEQPPELPQLFKEWIPSPEELSRHSAIFHQRHPPPTRHHPQGRRRWSAFLSQPTPSTPPTHHHHEPPPPDYFSLHPPDSAPTIPSPSSSETPSPIRSTSSPHSLTHLRRRFSSIHSFSLLNPSLAPNPSRPPHSSGALQTPRTSTVQDGHHQRSRPQSLIHPPKSTQKKAHHSLRNRLGSFFHLFTHPHHHYHPSPTTPNPNNPTPVPTYNKTLNRHSNHLGPRSSVLFNIPNCLSRTSSNPYNIPEEAESEEEGSEASREANRRRALADLERGGQRHAPIPSPPPPSPPRPRLPPARHHSLQTLSSPLQGLYV